MSEDDFTPPMMVFHTLACDQGQRWGYDKTVEDFAAYIRDRAQDPNLRADVETVWRFAANHFHGPGDPMVLLARTVGVLERVVEFEGQKMTELLPDDLERDLWQVLGEAKEATA